MKSVKSKILVLLCLLVVCCAAASASSPSWRIIIDGSAGNPVCSIDVNSIEYVGKDVAAAWVRTTRPRDGMDLYVHAVLNNLTGEYGINEAMAFKYGHLINYAKPVSPPSSKIKDMYVMQRVRAFLWPAH